MFSYRPVAQNDDVCREALKGLLTYNCTLPNAKFYSQCIINYVEVRVCLCVTFKSDQIDVILSTATWIHVVRVSTLSDGGHGRAECPSLSHSDDGGEPCMWKHDRRFVRTA